MNKVAREQDLSGVRPFGGGGGGDAGVEVSG